MRATWMVDTQDIILGVGEEKQARRAMPEERCDELELGLELRLELSAVESN